MKELPQTKNMVGKNVGSIILNPDGPREKDRRFKKAFLPWKRLNSHILSRELDNLLRKSQLFPNTLGDFARKRQLLQE